MITIYSSWKSSIQHLKILENLVSLVYTESLRLPNRMSPELIERSLFSLDFI